MDKSIVFLHVFLFFDKFACLRHFDTLKEVWQIFVNIDILSCHSPAELLELRLEYFQDDLQDESYTDHEHNRVAPVHDVKLQQMVRFHSVSCLLDPVPFVFEYLSVCYHPVAVHQKHQRSYFQHVYRVES
jgi:hypothetical protein